jgi:hypothetical protein
MAKKKTNPAGTILFRVADSFEVYEQQSRSYGLTFERAEDLELKLGHGSWCRFYRRGVDGHTTDICCVCLWPEFAEGCEFVRNHRDNVTQSEAELIAAVTAFWHMQNNRRRVFLESYGGSPERSMQSV